MQLVNATSVCFDDVAVLIMGQTGAGKSSLALELLSKGGTLISDDITALEKREGVLYACPAQNIKGQLEVRGIGILTGLETKSNVPVKVVIDLVEQEERFLTKEKYRIIDDVLVRLYQFRMYDFSLTNKVILAINLATQRLSVIEE